MILNIGFNEKNASKRVTKSSCQFMISVGEIDSRERGSLWSENVRLILAYKCNIKVLLQELIS